MLGQKGVGGGSGVFDGTLRMVGQVENYKPGVRVDYLRVGVLRDCSEGRGTAQSRGFPHLHRWQLRLEFSPARRYSSVPAAKCCCSWWVKALG